MGSNSEIIRIPLQFFRFFYEFLNNKNNLVFEMWKSSLFIKTNTLFLLIAKMDRDLFWKIRYFFRESYNMCNCLLIIKSDENNPWVRKIPYSGGLVSSPFYPCAVFLLRYDFFYNPPPTPTYFLPPPLFCIVRVSILFHQFSTISSL